jgi:hypothetical protein
MTDADARLKALLAEAPPPAMDARFRLEVLERIERRRAGGRLAVVLGAGVIATAAVAAISPQLDQIVSPTLLMVAGSMMATGATVWGVMQMRQPI